MKKALMEKIKAMIDDRITPGLILLVTQGNKILVNEAMGTTMYEDPGTQAVALNAIYDIASITKIITATGAMISIDQNQLSLDDRLDKFFPESNYGEKIVVRNLLTHTSGISVQMSKLTELSDRRTMHKAIIEAPIEGNPGEKVMFTNANAYLLGKIIEIVSRTSLDRFLSNELFKPLDMEETVFNPAVDLKARIPPTEITEDRGLIWGEVHDESAYALGGIVGHAGLFSTVSDLNRFCQLWLNRGSYKRQRFFSESLAKKATQNQTPKDSISAGLGWMLNRNWMGQLSPISFGHTGFTGPTIMITPRYDLIVVLMTNRTYPRRGDADRHAYQARIINELVAEFIE